ncbi:hypothetical protein GF406_26575 [candidate division KSB1 bacterium]|nr:hypothetical protein [candidate division KSB1 bacterium]
MKKTDLARLCLIIFLLPSSSLLTENRLYVSPTGKDNGSGTKEDPFLSFAATKKL